MAISTKCPDDIRETIQLFTGMSINEYAKKILIDYAKESSHKKLKECNGQGRTSY